MNLLKKVWRYLKSLIAPKPKAIDPELICPLNRHKRRRMATAIRKRHPSHQWVRAIHIPLNPHYHELQDLSALSRVPIEELTDVV